MALTLSLMMAFSFISGCSTTNSLKNSAGLAAVKAINKPRAPLSNVERARLLSAAEQAIGRSSLKVGNKSFRGDCSGAIRAIFTKAKIGLGGIIKDQRDNDVKTIYRYVQRYGAVVKNNPMAGDLVFFHNTYDRSRNGKMDDALTHIGLVEKVVGTTIHFIHHLGQSIIRSRMDLSLPKETYHPKTGERVNHILRRALGANRSYTAAELFAGFGRL